MQGLILAAGMGKRLKELTQDNTKCMVMVNGVRLIDRMLGQLARLGLKRTVIVTGYEGAKLRKHVGRKWDGMRIDYVDNPVYDKTNNIYSLALAADELAKDDTLLLESDIILEDAILTKVLDCPNPNVAVVDAFQSWMDGTCVAIDENNLIKRFVPKKDFVYEEIPTYYKTVNIYKFSKAFSREDYIPFLKAYSKALGDNEYYEQVLRVITLLDKPLMHALPLSGEKWYEIDDIQDLDIAESMFCSPQEQIKKLASRYGGYWRYPGLKDYTYLVNPYFPTSRMRAEMKNSFDALLENYPSGQRVNALLAAKTFGLKVGTVAVGNGAAEIINAWMHLIAGKIGFVYPTFEEYPNRIEESRRVVFTPRPGNGFRYTAKDMMDFFGKNPVSSIILINPDNPSGNFLPKKDVLKLIAWTKRKGIRLLIDESFVDFRSDARDYTVRPLVGTYDNLIVVQSLTKFFAIPGLRLGFAVTAPRLAEKLEAAKDPWNTNLLAQAAGVAALGDGEYQKKTLEWLGPEREYMYRSLSEFEGIKAYRPTVNFIFLRLSPEWENSSVFCERMKGKRILIRNCSNYPGLDDTYVRVAVKTREENKVLLDAFRRIREERA